MTTIAIANQKGGCGKTTTAINLAACLGRRHRRVLLMDMDPQGHASLGLGRRCEEAPGLYEVFMQDLPLAEVILPDVAAGVDLAPATISLAAVEHLLSDLPRRERQLVMHLAPLAASYDFVIIDCPPSLGLLSFNALRAADLVLIPVEMSIFSLDGIERLRETIDLLAEKYELDIPVKVLPTLVDYRPRFSRDALESLARGYADDLLDIPIHFTVRLKEAAAKGVPIIDHHPASPACHDYQALAEHILRRYGAPSRDGRETPVRHVPAGAPVPDAVPRDRQPGASAASAAVPAQEVTLVFRGLGTRNIKIAGDFNDWRPDGDVATEFHDGALKKVLRVKPGTYQYRLIIDGHWREDPTNPRRVTNEFGELNSVLEVAAGPARMSA